MRRWNGWGDDAVEVGLPAGVGGFLEREIGPGVRVRDATLEAVLAGAPAARTPAHPLVDADPPERLRHARGQSLPDWVALRSGRVGWLPDGVAHPSTDEEVRELLQWAAATGTALVPYGGGTTVAGHVTRPAGSGPTVTVALDRLATVDDVNPAGGLATLGAGIVGPALEAALRGHGTTLGHFPQSFDYSTLGGWIATRSSGQQSRGYGRIEDLFAGGHLETPVGPLDLPAYPASAAGPDLRQVVLGSEGRLGILTRATVRIAPLPEREVWPAFAMPDLERGLAVARELAQARLPLSMIRLQTPAETRTTLAMAGRPRTIAFLTRYLRLRGSGPERCLLLLALTGRRAPRGGRRPGDRRRSSGATGASACPVRSGAAGSASASARRTCATRSGTPATRSTRSRPPRRGRPCRASSRPSPRRCGTAWRRTASGSTRSATSRMSTRPARACTRRTCSACPATPTRPSTGGPGSRRRPRRRSWPAAGPSATSTGWAATTPRTWRPRREPSGWPRWAR